MRKTAIRILLWICVLMAFFPATVSADVDFTTDGAADYTTLYVAGNPDGFPVEGFDVYSGKYVGAAPAFLQLVSERTGLNFVYIRAGEQDRRESLVRNHQVDLLFAFSDESELLDLGDESIRLFSVIRNGTPTDVYCVFTAVSGEEDRTEIRTVAESLTKDELSLLITADSAQAFTGWRNNLPLILTGSALLIAVVAVIVLLGLLHRKKRRGTAFVDQATKIGNKQYFIQTFQTMISDPARELYYVIHFAFDIVEVNDAYGPEEADEILRYAADTITQRMKDNEFCARIGGGTFVAAIYCSAADQAENRVDEILRVLNAYSGKYKNSELKLLFRAGVCVLAIDDKNADKVLYNAEQAYRRAVKEKKPFVFVNHDVLEEQQARVSIREQAGEALDQRAFTPYVQFIVSGENGAICGGEMLSRWQNRLYGLLKPGTYVPILQDTGLIVTHDLLILEEACKLLQAWSSQGKNMFLSCNLTRVTLSDPSLTEKIMSITERYSFAKEKLYLEVTEDFLEEDKDKALRNISALKEKGFRIALDDFSSGYTSVANFYEYSVDLVKLDRQMVIDADQNPQAAALLTEITRMCHELHILVLAEGVETPEQARQIRKARCDYIQGYYYARPLPLRELEVFEERYRPAEIVSPAEPSATDSFEEQRPPEAVSGSEEAPEQAGVEKEPVPETIVQAEETQETTQEEPAQVSKQESEEAPEQTGVEKEPVPETIVQAEEPQETTQEEPAQVDNQESEEAPEQTVVEKEPVPEAIVQREEPKETTQEEPKQVYDQSKKEEPNMSKEEKPIVVQREMPQAKQPVIQILYGPYHMELPGDVDMDSVVGILRSIQKGFNENKSR